MNNFDKIIDSLSGSIDNDIIAALWQAVETIFGGKVRNHFRDRDIIFDIISDTVLSIYRSANKRKFTGHAYAWVNKIVTNKINYMYRKLKQQSRIVYYDLLEIETLLLKRGIYSEDPAVIYENKAGYEYIIKYVRPDEVQMIECLALGYTKFKTAKMLGIYHNKLSYRLKRLANRITPPFPQRTNTSSDTLLKR